MAGNLSADIAHATVERERLTQLLAETAAERNKKVRVLRAACDRNQQREQDVVDVAFILFVRGCPNYTVALEYASREFAKLNLPVLPDTEAAGRPIFGCVSGRFDADRQWRKCAGSEMAQTGTTF